MKSIKNGLIELARKNWKVKFFVLLFFKPKRFVDEYLYLYLDFLKFKKSIFNFKKFLSLKKINKDNDRSGLLIVSGRGMNVQWCQLWATLSAVYKNRHYPTYVLTFRNDPIRNLYFKLFDVELIFIEDLDISSEVVPKEIENKIASLKTFDDFKSFTIDNAPVGQMGLSTYGRHKVTGIIDVYDSENRKEICWWITHIYKAIGVSRELYLKKNIKMLFFSEVFMEEYGAFYYGALLRNLNIIRFAGTVRDDAIVAQHLTLESDRTHHAAVSSKTWESILNYPDCPEIHKELEANFKDRYGERWALSKRNQPNTRIVSQNEARKILGLPENRKIAVIYSHILYDTLFFFGQDLFPCYAEWFIASVKAACQNPNVQWFVKVHPSNLWRGELEHFFGGEYEEVKLIREHIGPLPDHVKLIYPDTPFSPYTWLKLTDYGITVRGTIGIELGAIGRTVITAGTGRYEKIGFTINPKTSEDYLKLLNNLPNVPDPTEDQKRLGARFAYLTFCMKPFTLDFFNPITRTGKKKIFSSDDLVFQGNFSSNMTELSASLNRFVEWSYNQSSIDLLNEWPTEKEQRLQKVSHLQNFDIQKPRNGISDNKNY